ncbi:MAG TPA: hypothetical protein VF823_00785, partial [Anaerolineales bacterium]
VGPSQVKPAAAPARPAAVIVASPAASDSLASDSPASGSPAAAAIVPAATAPADPAPLTTGKAEALPLAAVSANPPEAALPAVQPEPVSLPGGAAPVTIPPYLVSPAPALEEGGTVRMITIVLRSTGDKTRDVLRLRRIYGMITSYPGNDRFGFHVFERGRGYLLEFPNSTAGYCQDLMQRLTALVGADSVRVEPITFQ